MRNEINDIYFGIVSPRLKPDHKFSNVTGDAQVLATLQKRVINLTAKVTQLTNSINSASGFISWASDWINIECLQHQSTIALRDQCLARPLGTLIPTELDTISKNTLIDTLGIDQTTPMHSLPDVLIQTIANWNAQLIQAKSDLTVATNNYTNALGVAAQSDPTVIAANAAAANTVEVGKLKKYAGVAGIILGSIAVLGIVWTLISSKKNKSVAATA